ncbi:acetyl/propionyl/methylcrotonyl-CoA carboxylase subunit alpha [Spongiibacter taiwanensis]|uniref:acetyl/propionyl/methylcrotonyl-CoA carboxylase subunit alpha n=1 Tax=Spongiibacter taiwanensis TaxID=1748242 RepID=UPI002036064F|nr:acetyl/propionyl/methylcrotonyl-CoA carboxylase subunit alpha [Spongiibacter taiwanensis]USA42553.1 acetyl/propionyl/methylcrotonyl-CoA carboxylase subunit alpha [Spongiibacter taiwanensis]
MFNSVLIANRGEIACRVIRSARQMGIRSIAVYSDADRDAMHVALADEAVYLGGAPASESYLDMDKILAAAKQTGAEAIHPGYGFLSENAEFCRRCDSSGVIFIGPPVGAIEAMGSKSAAKSIMSEAGVPLLPGYHGDSQDPALLKNAAADIGYPVLLKASAGGGGKGMRIVWSESEFDEALAGAKREASKSFGDDKMLVEKYLTGPRHVEVQVFCDSLGNGVHLFERDCSLQRRHQKVIEEAPAPGMTEALRDAMGNAAVQAAKAINYCGAGTVEFLLADNGEFYFMEMNTRLQVEHPVTEIITKQDLVAWQFRVASGLPLPQSQHELRIHGHAFEARIYAEDTDNQFLPQTGTLNYLSVPEENAHVRIDTGVRAGDTISVHYDPMIAKLIVWDTDRASALRRLQNALAQFHISGVTTNRRFLQQLAANTAFAEEDFDTGFIDKHLDSIRAQASKARAAQRHQHLALAALMVLANQRTVALDNHTASPWLAADGWRTNAPAKQHLRLQVGDEVMDINATRLLDQPALTLDVEIEGKVYRVCGSCIAEARGGVVQADVDGLRLRFPYARQLNARQGASYCLFTGDTDFAFAQYSPDFTQQGDKQGELTAPMNGTIVALLVEPGVQVKKGAPLLIMEAMKMEHSITAPADGAVEAFHFNAGELVEGGAELLRFEPHIA